jgi:hypothetical protein
MTALDDDDLEQDGPGARDYALLALAGLLIVAVVLVQEDLGWWAAAPLAVGALGVLVPGLVGPTVVLLLLLVLLAAQGWMWQNPWGVGRPSALMDLVLAMAVLVYVAAHTRLLTIRRHALPPDPRRERRPPGRRIAGRWFLPQGATRRSAGLLPPGEFVALAAGVPVFALVAYLLWVRAALEQPPAQMDVDVRLWRALLVVWGAGVALLLGHAFLSYLGRARAGREESLLYLQDQLWGETRGEQRRLNAWLTWARLRRQRKEEGR